MDVSRNLGLPIGNFQLADFVHWAAQSLALLGLVRRHLPTSERLDGDG